MPSPEWIWVMICWWTVINGVFVGVVMARLGQIKRSLDYIFAALTNSMEIPEDQR